jgi:predicted nucleotidyltransferase
MFQKKFALQAVEILKADTNVLGIAVSGSWLTADFDEFSDLDLVLVTRDQIAGNKALMLDYANRLGNLLNGFTGEHVGEPRLLICLYEDPLIHVDIKFLLPEEFSTRVEDPQILYDNQGLLEAALKAEPAIWPFPGYQWMEDRFWIWLHYATTKLGRGELFEALDLLTFLRSQILAPLLLIKNNKLPKGVRKAEQLLPASDLKKLRQTVADYDAASIAQSTWNAVRLYQELRAVLYPPAVNLQSGTELRAVEYFEEISLFLLQTGDEADQISYLEN